MTASRDGLIIYHAKRRTPGLTRTLKIETCAAGGAIAGELVFFQAPLHDTVERHRHAGRPSDTNIRKG